MDYNALLRDSFVLGCIGVALLLAILVTLFIMLFSKGWDSKR